MPKIAWAGQLAALRAEIDALTATVAAATGAVGPAGPTGATGPAGPIGLTGPAGPAGPAGNTGATGPQGLQGVPGVAGAQGAQGLQGLPGLSGLQGAKGDTGATGPAGSAGAAGAQGIQGIQGATGPSGVTWTALVKQAADVTNALASLVNTDLVFTFEANAVYVIDLYLMCTSAAATTGYRFAFDTSVAVNVASLFFNHVLANTGTLTGGDAVADDTARGLSSGVNTAAVVVPIYGAGLIVAGATPGTARLRFGPEVAAAATFKANSVMRVHKII